MRTLLLALASCVPVLCLSAPVRADDGAALTRILESLAGRPHFPADLRVVSVERDAAGWVAHLDGTFDPGIPDVAADLRVETLVGALAAAGFDEGVRVRVPSPDGPRPLGGLDRRPGPTRPPFEGPRPGSPQRPRGEGALAGRRIAVSAGHGWLLDGGRYRTQRSRWAFDGCGNCRGITEDFFTAEVVTRQIVPLLQGMGAEVVLVRSPDLDHGPASVIDDGDPGHREEGPWAAGNSPGGHGDDYRTLAPEAVGAASFGAGFEAPAARRVAVRFREGGNRTAAALVEIAHLGGVTRHVLDQRRFGRFWLDLGSYVFGPGHETVRLLPGNGDGYLVADAVRFGGGAHESGHPWWQMSASIFVPWAGAPAEVTAAGDVTIRPRYAEHVGADAYVSIHANASGQAGGSTAAGLATYRYSCQQYGDHSRSENAVNCDDPPGSRALSDAVHQAILRNLRGEWDPNYQDSGVRVANFGELRDLDGTPGCLIESGFFDNLANPRGNPAPRVPDNRALHDPRWREAFAYGVVEGIARHLTPGSGAPPGRPDGLLARNRGRGMVEISWRAVPGATAYRLYTATRGRAWDDGVRVEGTEAALSLRRGEVRAFRVAAVNLNGEGFASQAVAVRVGDAPQALLVYAYDRRDAWVQDQDNDLQHAIEHAHPLGEASVVFDGALDERVEARDLALGDYALVDFVAGKDSVTDQAVSPAMRALLTDYVAAGGALILSGEEVGYALVERSQDPADRAFFEDVLGAAYVEDDAEAYALSGVEGPFAGIEAAIDDGTGGVYEVVYPDVLAPAGDSRVAMVYPDGRAAAVYRDRVITFGTPLEAIVPEGARHRIFRAAVTHLLGEVPVEPENPDAGPPADAGPLADAALADAAPPEPDASPAVDAEPRFDATPDPDLGHPDDAAAPRPDARPMDGTDATSPPIARVRGDDGCAISARPSAPWILWLLLLPLLWRRHTSSAKPGSE